MYLAGVALSAQSTLPSREDVQQVMSKLSEITGMPVRHRLRFQSISRAQVASFLDERVRETIKPSEIQNEEAALEFLGFVPHGFDLQKVTLDLMTEQAAAFYDFDKKELFLTDWAPVSMRDTAVVHELAHALADQNFHLGRYTRKVENEDEKSTARQSVVEGQASYLMLSYDAAESGKSPFSIHPDPNTYDDSVTPTGDYPVFDHAPLYLRMSLVFPYTWGMGFQAALVDKLGRDGFSEPYRHAPVSTRQIIHPDVYLAGVLPRAVSLPKPPHGFKTIFEGDLGELDHRVLIQQFVSLEAARRVSPQWRGGGFRVAENKRTHALILFYASEWQNEANAAAFAKIYQKFVEGKSKKIDRIQNEANGFSGHNERGHFRVTVAGTRVTATEGSPTPL